MIYIYIYVALTVKEKEATNLKESRERYVGGLGKRKGKNDLNQY